MVSRMTSSSGLMDERSVEPHSAGAGCATLRTGAATPRIRPGKHVRRHRVPVIEDNHRADDVLQLANVAGPVIGEQRRLGLGSERAQGLPVLTREAVQEIAGDQQHVALALAQRRQLHGHDVQPVEKILAEPSCDDLRLRIAVGRAHDAHIGRARRVFAHAAHLALLQEAQDFRLERYVHLADFIEEKRAAVGLERRALAVGRGAGERAFHMAEDFAFKQVPGNGGAIDDDEWPRAALAEAMQGVGAQFLAGAAFARHEHRRVARSRALEQAVDGIHPRGIADEARKALCVRAGSTRRRRRARVRLRRLFVNVRATAFERCPHGVPQTANAERLHEEIARAVAHRIDRKPDRSLAGDDDDLRRDARRAHAFQDVDAVHVGQIHIENDDVGRRCPDRIQRRLAIACDLDVRAFGPKIGGVTVRKGRHVFNYQYLR